MSRLIDKTLTDYINDVDSPKPAPGGGSVMGVVGSLACALAGMVGHLTVSKKNFLQLAEEEREVFNKAVEKIKEVKSYLINIIDKDAESFGMFMEAMKMPKETSEEKEKRKKAISDASKKAAEIPFMVLQYCYELIPSFDIIIKYGNRNVITDIASAYILIFACAKGSLLNININLPMIDDNMFADDIKIKTSNYIKTIEDKYHTIEKKIQLFSV